MKRNRRGKEGRERKRIEKNEKEWFHPLPPVWSIKASCNSLFNQFFQMIISFCKFYNLLLNLIFFCFVLKIYIWIKLQIQQNARKQSNIKNPTTGTFLEFDFWLPKYNLCFEFQDECHYSTTWYNHVPLEEIQRKDTIFNFLIL